MTQTVSKNSSNIFMCFTAEQLLVLEEILEKEVIMLKIEYFNKLLRMVIYYPFGMGEEMT